MSLLKPRVPVISLILLVMCLAALAWGAPLDDYEAGKEAARQSEFDKAIELFTRAIQSGQMEPRDLSRAHYSRGNAWLDKGDLKKAIADLNKALELDPDYANAYYTRGFAWDYAGERQKAIADFSKAIQLNPRDADAFFARGNAWFDAGKAEAAIKDFSKVIEIRPNSSAALYNRALAYDKQGDTDKALADAQAALRLEPDSDTFKAMVKELEAKKKDLQ